MGISQKRETRFGSGGRRTDVLSPPAPAHPLCAGTGVGRVRARASPTPSIAAFSGYVPAGAFWPGLGGGREHAKCAWEQRVRVRSRSRSAFRIRDDVLAVRVRFRRTLVELFFFGRAADPFLVIGLDAPPCRTVFLFLFLSLARFSTSRSREYDRGPTTANGSWGGNVERPRISGGRGGGGRGTG